MVRFAAALRRRTGPAGTAAVDRALLAVYLLGVGCPKEYGGRGYTAIEQFTFAEEARRANAPVPLVTLNTVGPTLMLCGANETQRDIIAMAGQTG